jgi:colicin import membrane protein
MNAAPAQDLNPPAAGSSGPALALSLLAHALLVLALAWGVNWSRTDPTVAFSAEIWAPVAEQAAPAATAPEATPKPTPPPPQERPAPPPPPPPPSARVQQEARDAELALEKRRKEKQKAEEKAEKQAKEKAQKDKAEKAAKEKAEKEKVEKDRKEKEDKQRETAKEEARKEQDRKEAAESEKRRQEQLRRIQGQASSTTATGTPGASGAPEAKGTAQRSAAPSSSYGGKIVQLIKDNTKFTDPNSGRPSVVVLVRTSPQGKIDLKELKIISTSGNQAFDEAVLRGIQKMESVPKDIDGRVPEVLLREGLELKVTL